jgi:hypothetical protein
MSKYLIRINSAAFQDIEIEAVNKGEAIDLALAESTLDEPEYNQILKVTP